MSRRLTAPLCHFVCAASLALLMPAAQAHGDPSEASAISALPVALSVAAPAMLLSAGATLSLVAVEASAEGTVWIVERASDGARASLRFSGKLAQSALLSTGTAIVVTAISAGHVLSAAGQAIAFVPSEIGRALMHHEAITK